ncbi:MAG: DNA polymerase III subunit delta [Gammaproteobacteria bacterium]|jgi:DNA polymerase-3 subunit delta|nr:DNA polymerase III subunit delta [Gammaproteobacteria bacterium]NCX48238.1 DNA polymerase III subunit delta [Gammaproteobacteria bacterium]
MAIKASEFDGRHWNNGLPPVAALLGDEAFFITRIGDLWRKTGKDQGFTERLVLDQTEPDLASRLLSELDALSLFADQTLVELRLSKATLDKSLREALDQWLQNPPDDKRLLISGPKLGKSESSTIWLQTLEKSNAVVEANAVPSYQFAKWLDSELQSHHIVMDPEAKSAVQMHTEGNLLAAGQVIERLKLIQPDLIEGPTLSLDQVLDVLTQSARHTVYDLVDLAIKSDVSGLNRITDLLKAEGVDAMTALWAISRELDILLQIRYRMDQGESANQAIGSLRVWRSREGLVRGAVNRLNLTQLRKLLTLCHDTDRTIKGATPEPAWAMIKDILLGLAGHPMAR